MKHRGAILPIVLLVGISGCSVAPEEPGLPSREHNRSDQTSSAYVLTDDGYVAYRDAHANSPKIPPMIVAMIRRHMTAREYRLAMFYCNEYRRDFPSGHQRAEVEYLWIRIGILQYIQTHDDRVAEQTRHTAKAFLALYHHTPYRAKAQTLLVQLRQEQNAHYEQLAQYYAARNKPKAAAFYRAKIRR